MDTEDLIEVTFLATIRLFRWEIVAADGDVLQAVQDEIGSTGAQVIEIRAKDCS